MRYILLLLTILTAGFSVWYYQRHISPEGEELAARKTAMEEAAATLEQTVNRTRQKLGNAQDASREAELAAEKFQESYLEQKRQHLQTAAESASRQADEEHQEEEEGHNQKLDQLRQRIAKQREKAGSAKEELLQKKEQIKELLGKLAEKQQSIQKEVDEMELALANPREEAKAKRKSSSFIPEKEKVTQMHNQMYRIRQAVASANEKMKAVDAALKKQEEAAGKLELRMQKMEERLTQEKNAALAGNAPEETSAMELADEDLLATAEYREQSRPVREAVKKTQQQEETLSRAYDKARSELRRISKEGLEQVDKEEKEHASFRKLFTGGASAAGFILLLFTVGAFRRIHG